MSFVNDDDDDYKTVKSFFYVHRIGKHDKQKILNLELVLLYLKHTISHTKVFNHRFLRKKKLMCLQVLMLLYLFRICLHLWQKCKIFIFCFLVLGTHTMLFLQVRSSRRIHNSFQLPSSKT
jgi:hypothetical protein